MRSLVASTTGCATWSTTVAERTESQPELGAQFGSFGAALEKAALAAVDQEATVPVVHSDHILVVEDDIIVREVVLTCLEIAGYKTTWATTGSQAIQSVRQLPPRAVILDIGLPGMDGFKVLREIRGKPATSRAPVLMLTSSKEADDVKRAIALGASDYLVKPVDHRVLLSRLERQLRSRPP